MQYLLDTNIISHMMREPAGQVSQRFMQVITQDVTQGITTSVIVLCELRFGLQRKPNPRLDAALERILGSIDVLPLDAEIVPHYQRTRALLEQQGTPIGPHDTLIAAHALALGATLVSADTEFTRVPGLALDNWLQSA